MKKLVLESTSPFQGLPELVAYREGLFEQEGLQIEWADRDEAGVKEVARDANGYSVRSIQSAAGITAPKRTGRGSPPARPRHPIAAAPRVSRGGPGAEGRGPAPRHDGATG